MLLYRPSCRFEWITSLIKPQLTSSIKVLCDACHNPHAFQYMVHDLSNYHNNNKSTIYHVIIGMCEDKDIKNNLKEILSIPNLESIIFTKSQNARAASSELLSESLKNVCKDKNISISSTIYKTDNVSLAINKIKDVISKYPKEQNQVIVICGSFFLMGESRKLLGVEKEYDSIDMNEVWNKK